jgi:hypothetical protein
MILSLRRGIKYSFNHLKMKQQKPKFCKWKDEPCEDERVRYPGKSILSPFCLYHLRCHQAIKHIHKERSFNVKSKAIEKRQNQKEKKENKIDLMGVDKYRAEVLQPIFNEIVRLIDYQCPCIATGLYDGKMNGGHFHSVNSNRTIALNLHNIHNQSYHSNGPTGGGDNIRYRQGIVRTYGQEYMDLMDSLGRIQPIHLTKWEMVEIKEKASVIRLELKANLKYRTPEERIALREAINQKIGIYE